MPPAPVNILLVDDEPKNLDILEELLRQPEHHLVRASNANDALVALLQKEFALIVMDVQMPEISGIELAHLIKRRARTQHLPIIFLTAYYEDEQKMMESYGVGAVDYLTKPVNAKVLLSKVGVFVELYRKNTALAQEIAQREKAEAALRRANEELEERVAARTAELSRLTGELRQARDRAEEAGRAKDEFLAALSHELRTPLNPVLLLASDAATNADFPPEARSQFASIRKNVELEARLIDDLLDLTKITHGKMALDRRPCDVHAILHDALATVHTEITQKQLRLQLELGAPQATIEGDPVRLQQVLWNLLRNAVKFTPDAGAITVRTSSPASGRLRIQISDTGIGLTPEEAARVFDAFAQGAHADGRASHRFGGLGLGLTISRGLVAHHDGTITAESEGPGRGATFTVELPLLAIESPPPAAARRPREDSSIPATSGSKLKTILLVEDHEPTRRTLETLLRRRQFDVASTASISNARTLAAERRFDLLISDIGLPDGTGFDLMREIKESQDIPGIALTGYGMVEDVDRSHSAGFAVHLTKPIHVQSLDLALAKLGE